MGSERYQQAGQPANPIGSSTVARERDSVILIGMPGSGKSTVGRKLAQRLRWAFVDTDVLLEQHCGLKLREILAERGVAGFQRAEEEVVLSLRGSKTVIATGGSVVYSPRAMEHLRSLGAVVYLQVDLDVLRGRLGDLDQRGIVRSTGQSLESLYAEREPLYARYADAVVPATALSPTEVVERIVAFLDDRQHGW